MKYLLGVDAGTSGIKVIILDEKGTMHGQGYCECDIYTPYPGYVEQNPEDWWKACSEAVKQATASCDNPKAVCGIGFSGQMQGLVCIDKDGKSLGNCMIWQDQRATKETEEIDKLLTEDEALKINASYCLNSYWAPKILWLKKNKPEIYEKVYKVVFTKDYLRLRMTGEIATEVSDASMTYLLDVPNRKWSKRMFDVLGIPQSIVPEKILESCEVAGYLLPEIANDWGLTAGIPVVAGAGDQPANGVGSGIVDEGTIGVSFGTSGVVFGCSKEPLIIKERAATYSMCHAVPGKWSFLGLALTSGGSYKWLRNTLFGDYKEKGYNPYKLMDEYAEKASIGSEGLNFLPYLNGEKTPINDECARGAWIGLSQRHGLPELCRSVMEGVTFSLRDSIELMKHEGLEIKQIIISGGGATSPVWRQIAADIFGSEVCIMNVEEGPAAGACILAGVGAGVFKTVEEGCKSMLSIQNRIQPIEENVKIYNDYYESYRMLYPALKEYYARQAKIISSLIK